jgi:hypothetical protein
MRNETGSSRLRKSSEETDVADQRTHTDARMKFSGEGGGRTLRGSTAKARASSEGHE